MLPFEWNPEIPIATLEEPRISHHKSKEHGVPPQLEKSPGFPATTEMEPLVSPHNTSGGLAPLLQLKKKPELPISIQDEA